MDEIRIGLVGARRGLFVPMACRIIGGMQVVAVHDTLEENAAAAAAEIPDCKVFGPDGWEAFLASGINAAVIASPIPFHAAQSIACLERGIHVLCEVTATASLDEAMRLASAANASSATYTLAENCCFLDGIELFKRITRAGLLGRVFHAEGSYLHDCRHLYCNPDGSRTWRGEGGLGVYCTHPLGPILDIMDDRITQVTCVATPVDTVVPGMPGIGNHQMLLRTAKGGSIMLRVDHMSPQPYRMQVQVQGSAGVCELIYGQDTEPRICMSGEHAWSPATPYIERFIPDRMAPVAGADRLGHDTMEYWMLKEWAAALHDGTPVPIDVHRALDYTLPGIVAQASALQGGVALPVPDSRTWR